MRTTVEMQKPRKSGGRSDVFASVLLSDDMHRISTPHRKVRKSQRQSFAPRANVVVPEEDQELCHRLSNVSSSDLDSFVMDDGYCSDFESSDVMQISAQEFNSKPLSWRVSYVVMRQFQAIQSPECYNSMNDSTPHSNDLQIDQQLRSMMTNRRMSDVQLTNHVDLATKSNFYDIDNSHKKRLARASFFKSMNTKSFKQSNKCRFCPFMDKYMLTSESTIRQIWDIVVLILLLYTMIYLPLKVAFYNQGSRSLNGDNQQRSVNIDPADLVVDILFFIDIIMSFMTAIKLADGTAVKRFDDVAIKYLKSWFLLDVIATFPFYLIGSTTLDRIAPIIRIPRLLKMLRLVRLVKLLRAYRIKKFFEKVEYSPKIHQGYIRIFKLLLLVICFAHFSACLWFFIGDISEDSEGFSWISDLDSVYGGVKDEDVSIQYVASLYFAISTLSTVGFGDITPQNGMEMGFAVVLMLIGATTFSYITATISSVMHDFDLKASMYRSKMANLVRFVKASNLTKKLSNKLINDMSNIWRSDIKTQEDTSKLRDELPRLLLYEVSLEMHADLINTSAFFRLFDNLYQERLDEEANRNAFCGRNLRSSFLINDHPLNGDIADFAFIGELVSEMRPETAFDGEFIANVAEPVNFWAIIKSGSVVGISAIDSSLELMLWGDGDSLGEVGIFLTQQWPWNMRCTEDTAYFTVSTSDLLAIIAHHRSVSRKLVKLAGQRIERIVKIKKKVRNMRESQLRRSYSRQQSIRGGAEKSKLHYRLQSLINAKKECLNKDDDKKKNKKQCKKEEDELSEDDSCGLVIDHSNELSELAQKIQNKMKHDPLRGTARGRWKMLRLYLLEIVRDTRSKRDKFRTNFREVTQLAMQVKRFQDALDEIQRDMVIWKQGMTFKANRSNRNFLQPSTGLILEE